MCRPISGLLSGSHASLLLHGQFGLQARQIARHRNHRQNAPRAFESKHTIMAGDVSVDVDLIPFLGVTHIVDAHVVVLTPKERHGSKWLGIPQHIARRGLSLTLGNHPMLDAHVLATVWVGPARNIAGRKDSRLAGLEKAIYQHTTIDGELCRLSQINARTYANAGNH